MAKCPRENSPAATRQGAVDIRDDTFMVDAALIGELLGLSASRVPLLMRRGEITSVCERGFEEHAGEFRLSFFYSNRRARLSTDLEGRILRKSIVAFADRPLSGTPAT